MAVALAIIEMLWRICFADCVRHVCVVWEDRISFASLALGRS